MNNFTKVLLFEKFADRTTLTNILSETKGQDQLSDTKLMEIENTLGVSSFEEFLEKFAPTIYQITTMADDGYHFSWSFERPKINDDSIKAIKLDKNFKVLKGFITAMDDRKASGKDFLEYDIDDAFQEFLPQKAVEEAKMLRGDLEYLYGEMEKIAMSNPNFKEDPNFHAKGKKFMETRLKITEQYDKNALELLPLMIEDTKKRLEMLEKNESDDPEATLLQIGNAAFDDKGELVFIPLKDNPVVLDVDDTVKKLPTKEEILRMDYKRSVPAEQESTYCENMIVRTYSGALVNEFSSDLSIVEVKEKLNSQLDLYKERLESSFVDLKEAIQKILNVKAFFDEFTEDRKPKLIVANNSLSELASRKDDLERYISSLNSDTLDKHTACGADIWLAILPRIKALKDTGIAETPADYMDYFTGDLHAQDSNDKDNMTTSISSARTVLDVLDRYQIVSFVSFDANVNTTYESLKTNGTSKWEEILKNCGFKESDYIVPCFPNFTIVDEYSSKIQIDADKNVYAHGVYVEASYVCAALVAKYIEPTYLKAMGFDNVKNTNPGVRINLEEFNLGNKITTTFTKESSKALLTKTKQKLADLKCGFINLCDSTNDKMYAFLCRTTSQIPLYKTLVDIYLTKLITTETGLDSTKIEGLKNGLFRDLNNEHEYVNSILKEEDNISLVTDEEDSNKEPEINISFEQEKPRKLKIKLHKKDEK